MTQVADDLLIGIFSSASLITLCVIVDVLIKRYNLVWLPESVAAMLIGAVAGGFLGSNIGSGRASNTAGAIGGAMVGSAIASQAQQAMTSRRGIEISVRLDQGGSVAIVQEVNPREQFSVGDRVRIISSGGRSRVSY